MTIKKVIDDKYFVIRSIESSTAGRLYIVLKVEKVNVDRSYVILTLC